MQVVGGDTNVTTYFAMRLTADGKAATGLTITGFDLQYTRSGVAPTAKVDATALVATDSAHADNKAFEIDGTDQPGLYRVDWPDAAFAASVREVILTVKVATCFTEHLAVQIDAPVDVTKWTGTAVATPTTAGVPEVELSDSATHGGTSTVITAERLIVASTTTNEPGIKATGDGTGDGMLLTGGISGSGLNCTGGATAGDGIEANSPGTGAEIDADITGNITGNLSGSIGSLGATAKTDVNAECDTAIETYGLDHLVSASVADEVVDNSIIAKLASTTADWSTFAWGTDALQAIRDQGDAAWTTGAGGSDRLLMIDTTIDVVSTQTSFTLVAGAPDNDAYNNCTIVIEDASTATQKAVGLVSDWVGGATLGVTLKYDPGIFTMASGDKVYILAENALKATAQNRQLDVTAAGTAGIDWGNVENKATANDLSGTDIQLVDAATTVTGAVGSVTGAVGSVAGNVDGSTASVTGAVGSVTGSVGSVAGNVDGSTASVTGAVGSVTGSVGSVTGAVGSVTGAVGSVTGAVGSVAGNVDGSTASVTGAVGSVTGAVGSVAGNVDGSTASVTGAVGSVTGSVGSLGATAKTDVNTEVLDVMNTDTLTLPGQTAPSNTPTHRGALALLYKLARNKTDQTATLFQLYDDAGSTVDTKATVSDDGTTAQKGELVSGP